jgi:hypothetical protein
MATWKRWSASGLILSASLLAACGGSSSSPTTELRVIHASGNAPAVNLNVNGASFAPIQGLEFGQATSRLRLRPALYTVSVDAVLPGDDVTEVVAPTDLDLESDRIYSVVALGNVGGAGATEFRPLVIDTPRNSVSSASTRVQVVHASANVEQAVPGGVSVYVTGVEDSIGGDVAPLVSFNLGDFTDAVTVPAGEYRIRITPADDSGTVLFDSGAIGLPGGADLMVLAVDNFGPGGAARLLVSTGNADADFFIVDAGAQAAARIIHAASGVGNAEVFASSPSLGLDNVTVIESFAYREQRDGDDIELLGALPVAADYTFRVNAAGGGAEGAPIVAGPVGLDANTFYTVLAAGDLPMMGDPDLTLLLAVDDRRKVATEARVRAIHAASLAGTVAVFVTPAGEETVVSIEMGDVEPTLAAFTYESITPYLSLSPGSYDVRVAVPLEAGYLVAIDQSFHLDGGSVSTLVATNPADDGDDFAFVVLSD